MLRQTDKNQDGERACAPAYEGLPCLKAARLLYTGSSPRVILSGAMHRLVQGGAKNLLFRASG